MAYDYLDLNTQLTKEEVLFKQAVREFAQKEIRPAAIELDNIEDPQEVSKKGSLFWKCLKKMRQLDYHSIFIPEELGGSGLSPIEAHIFFEELSWGSAGLAMINAVDSFPALLAVLSGKEDVIKDVVPRYVEDKNAKICGCWAVTEPDLGFDAVLTAEEFLISPDIHLHVQAELKGSEYILNGQKSSWVGNGPAANYAALFLTIDPGKGMGGGAVAIVPLDLPGISKGTALNKLGQRDYPQCEIFFDNVRIPKHYMVVMPEEYGATVELISNLTNAIMAASFTGVARAAFEEALTHAKGRVQGGKIICNHQVIQQKLFEMFMKVETARAVSRAAMTYNFMPRPPRLEYSIAAKVYCTQASVDVADEAIQICGGYGLSREYPVEKLYRDARASLIEDGTNEVLALQAADLILRKYK